MNDHQYGQEFIDSITGADVDKKKILSGFTFTLTGLTLKLYHNGKHFKTHTMELRDGHAQNSPPNRYVAYEEEINFSDGGAIDNLVDVRSNDTEWNLECRSKRYPMYENGERIILPKVFEVASLTMTKYIVDHYRGRRSPCGDTVTFLPHQ